MCVRGSVTAVIHTVYLGWVISRLNLSLFLLSHLSLSSVWLPHSDLDNLYSYDSNAETVRQISAMLIKHNRSIIPSHPLPFYLWMSSSACVRLFFGFSLSIFPLVNLCMCHLSLLKVFRWQCRPEQVSALHCRITVSLPRVEG